MTPQTPRVDPPDPGRVREILVIKFKHIGDVLLATPVLTALRRRHPAARITALVSCDTAPILENNPDLDRLWCLPRRARLWAARDIYLRLLTGRFDVVVDLSGGGDRGAICSGLTRAPWRYGVRKSDPAQSGNWLIRWGYNRLSPHPPFDRHTVLRDLWVVRDLLGDPGAVSLVLHAHPDAAQRARVALQQAGLAPGQRYIVVHPTSRWMFKCLPPATLAQVVQTLAQRGVATPVLTCGPADVERQYLRQVIDRMTIPALQLPGVLALGDVVALLAGSTGFLGVDTAPAHMAAALDVPAVVLFGPSDPRLWGPWSNGTIPGKPSLSRHHVVSLGLPCQPCPDAGCHNSRVSRCLVEMSADSIIHTLEGAGWLRAAADPAKEPS
ncbi:MAG: putative lipopolysaccharide heptosyltransferase III [Magnetococcus sp. WYHC-3]